MAVPEALETVGAAVEGYYAAASVRALAQKMEVEMPIVEAAYQVMYENIPAQQAVHTLLLRQKRPESEDAGWNETPLI